MIDTETLIGAVTYTAGAVAFALLTIPLLASWRGRLQGGLLILACGATLAWTGLAAYGYWRGHAWVPAINLLEVGRTLSWIAFLWIMLDTGAGPRGGLLKTRTVVILGAPIVLVILASAVLDPLAENAGALGPQLFVRLLLAVAGLVLTETLFRNTPQDQRWHIKFLCLATGGMFAYDLFLYADAMLFRQLDGDLVQARGVIQVLVAPLLAVSSVRNRMWRSDIALSRQIVLHTTALIGSGGYLFLMAAAGFYLRQMGGHWGPVFQAMFLAGAVGMLLVVLFSGTVRSYLRVFIDKHFFRDRYDYRTEWLRFMQTVASGQDSAALEERVVKAVADIVDSPGGAMWLCDVDRYVPAASWNLTFPVFEEPVDGALAGFMSRTRWVVDLDEVVEKSEKYEGLTVPEPLRAYKRAWLIVPLWHHSLTGFIVLARPRAPHALVWEDFDLLKTVGRQTASYVAEQAAARALTEARQFENFNRRFAFVVHDIKNLASQLALVPANFAKHADNPAFRDDTMETLKNAVSKMKHLVDRINATQISSGSGRVRLAPLVAAVVASRESGAATLTFQAEDDRLVVPGDRERLEHVVDHLIQNAIEAVGDDGKVSVSLARDGDFAVVEITDDGPGMDADFVRDELFRPFRSTKEGGMGIGVFQCREYTRELGGHLDAVSSPGEGTTMRMVLPAVDTLSAKPLPTRSETP